MTNELSPASFAISLTKVVCFFLAVITLGLTIITFLGCLIGLGSANVVLFLFLSFLGLSILAIVFFFIDITRP